MRDAELEGRLFAAAVMSRLIVTCCEAMHEGYQRDGKNMLALFPEVYIIMLIRMNDSFGTGRPVTAYRIHKITNLPYPNVRRWMLELCEQGAIRKSGRGYSGNDDFLVGARMRAPYFLRMVAEVLRSARELAPFAEAMGLL
jgi:hypothetical protein